MPELPEVETVCRGLRQSITGKKIHSILVRETRLREPVDPDKLQRLLTGQQVRQVERRAKYIIITLSGNCKILAHLGMSGQMVVQAATKNYRKHDHLVIELNDGLQLRFYDPRRFGLFLALDEKELARHPRLQKLGLEPLDNSTTATSTFARVQKSQKSIKNLLMDGNFIAGVGNIYANEALFFAGIHPQKVAASLRDDQWAALLHHIKNVLNRAIEQGGTTLNDFVNSDGDKGYFQIELAVYGRESEACKSCSAPIERIVQSGRSSFFCPQCQKL